MTTRRGNRDLMRGINRSIILNTIKTYGLISRAEIARLTRLSPATVTGITGELISENLVIEKAAGDSSGGRRPILLAINPSGGYVIGIKLMETQVTGALTDLKAGVVSKCSFPLGESDIDAVIEVLTQLVNALAHEGNIRKKQLLGVGIGLAGVVDSSQGVVRQSPYFGWRNLPLRDRLQSRLRIPVFVDNDVNTLTLSEKWFGAGQSIDHFITLTIGRGIGMGIVVDGQLYRGKNGGAGEFGHTVINPNGPECACGRHGCLETYVSDQGLLNQAAKAAVQGQLPEKPESIDELVHFAMTGNLSARQILAEAGTLLGIQIANLVNIFDPGLVIISGEGIRVGELFFQPLREAVRNNVMPGLAEDTQIRIDTLGDDAWALGAASLVLGELFQSPVHHQEK